MSVECPLTVPFTYQANQANGCHQSQRYCHEPGRSRRRVFVARVFVAKERTVRLTSPGGAGTLINWTASFQCRYGAGWFWRLFMNRILSDLAKQLAVAAENLNSAA
jgi:hypothetical protein